MRILLVSEHLGGAPDEGIKNLCLSLLGALRRRHEARALTGPPGAPGLDVVSMNRFFLNRELLREARRFSPDAVLYVPWTSGTARTFWRGWLLKRATGSPVAILLTQPYAAPRWEETLMRPFLPDLVLAQNETTVELVLGLGGRAAFVPSGVDHDRFRLPSPEERAVRRRTLAIGPSEHVVLHVGHLNDSRMRVSEIVRLASRRGRRLIVVGSTHTPQDPAVVRALEAGGCLVVKEFVPRIEHMYWAADAYLFPTRHGRSSIGVPLSVLEALACGLPVVSTPFGALPRLFPDSPFLRFADSHRDLDRALDSLPPAPDAGARALVAAFSWETVATRLEQALLGLRRPKQDVT